MTTEAGLNRWQAPVINEDHKNGQETAFWGIVIQGTLKRRLSMINFKNFQNFKKDSSITNKWGELFLTLFPKLKMQSYRIVGGTANAVVALLVQIWI